MPFPRFSKLPLEKRERLMEAAAQEFAAYGFDERLDEPHSRNRPDEQRSSLLLL